MAGVSHESYPGFVLRDKSRACKQWFRDCLETPNLDYDDWLEQKYAEFNWWSSGLNADKSGPGSLDARLRLRPDVRDVLVDILDGLESALCKFYQISISGPLLVEEERAVLADEARPLSPWSDMSDSSNGDSSASPRGEKHEQDPDKNASLSRDIYHEQRVYINTNLEILIRIHTAIKRSGLKFRNQSADDALKRAEEDFQLQKAELGEHLALQSQNGKHERFRRYLTRIILWNSYTQNLVQKISCGADIMAQRFTTQDKRYPEFLLQRKLLIVIRAYLHDPARLLTVQRRLINANVIRRNRLAYAGRATKQSFRVERAYQAQPTAQESIQQTFLSDQAQSVPVSSQSPLQTITPVRSRQSESKAGRSFVAQPATDLESKFSITEALTPPRATKSSATKMSDRVGHLDYPKCPAKHGQFPCPYCPIILTEDYTKKEKWRGHVAQDLCAYICVFEDCESSDEMFSSTYEWMLHMATFHSETEWVCHKCTKNPGRPEQEVSVVFPTPTLLREHFHASHPSLDPSEYSFLVDAGKRVSGIQKVRCPLCRPGLVTFEQDEEDDNMTPPPSAGHEIGLVQLEEDEHIATHIHEFALHSFPSPEEEVSESSPAISHSCPSTRVEITFKGSGGLEAPHNGSSSLYSLSDITSMLDDLLGEITIISNKQEHDMQRLNDIRNLFDISKVRLKDLEESADIDALALALNESRAIVSRLKEELLGQDTEESLLDQLFDALDRSNKVLQQVLEEVTIQKNDKRARYHIPFPRNHHFIGRDAIFNELDEKFFSPKQCRKAALHGMAGIGKTQVALEFAYRVKENRPEYSILWISMSTDKRTEQDYIKIAGQLGVEELSDDHGFEEPVCRHILSDKASKYLLVVDEMDDSEPSLRRNQKPGIIQRFAESENSLILLTTRDRALAADFADTIEVGQMDHEEAARFLECLLTEKQILQDSAATTELLSYLSYHPLGITHAASYLNNIRLSIQGYQKQLNDIEPYDNKLPMKCLFLFLDVEQKDYVAVDLLSFISFIEPTAIPKSILPYFEKEEQERAIETLYEHTLIIRKKNSFFNMHTLVQVAAQTWIESRGRKQQVLNDAICHVAKIFNTLDRAYSRPWSEYLPHIIRLLKHTVGYEIKERCDLILEVGEYLSRERRYKQATKCLEQLCQWRGKNLPEEDDSLLQSRSALAYAYFDSGQTEKAIEIFKHIVAVRRKVLPKGNHIRHQSEYELAIAYLTNGQIKGAIMLFEHVVAVRQITLPTENHYRLMSEQGLAKAYIASGQSQKAVEIFEHIVPVRRETLVEESEFRLVPERWLAHLYLISGRTEEAIKILEHVVAVHEKILPEEHHDRLLCKDDLARGYLISGRTEEAIKILGHIVAVHEKILPEEHHDRLLSKDHLARAYYASGWTKEAIKILEYVVAVRKKILPEDHSNRSSSEYMLAKAYHTSGRTMEAVKILENIVRLDISDEDKARSQDLLTEALTALKVGPGSAPST